MTPIIIVMYSMTSGVSLGSSSSGIRRLLMTTIVSTTAHAAAIARVRTSHSDMDSSCGTREAKGRAAGHLDRARRMAVARTAGAVIMRVAVTTEVPLFGSARVARR